MIANIKQRLVLLLSLVCLLAGGTLSVQARQSLLTNYTPNGKPFKYETAINFQKQSFKAVLDLSTCDNSKANENVLSIGDDRRAQTDGVASTSSIFSTQRAAATCKSTASTRARLTARTSRTSRARPPSS